jgi:hypothetical protein
MYIYIYIYTHYLKLSLQRGTYVQKCIAHGKCESNVGDLVIILRK